MTQIESHSEEPRIAVSFEFFPPKTAAMEEVLWQSVERLAPLQPNFVSVTYGAGGSTRERTHNIVARLARETPLLPAAHLTCVGASRGEVDDVVRQYGEAGVRHIVALRGDPPGGPGTPYAPHPQGYATTADLVAGIKRLGDFEVSVSAYPERHPASADWDTDLDVLAAKVDAGAERAITQYFFDNDHFYRYRDRMAARGIEVELVPGILPIASFAQTTKFSAACGTTVPHWLHDRFEGLDDDPDTRRLVAASVVADQIRDLAANGVSEFHFYTLNKAELTFAACHMLGLRPQPRSDAA